MTHEATATLPLKGEKGGRIRSLDGKEVLEEPADPLVVERAKDYAQALDKIDSAKYAANQRAGELEQVMAKSKKRRWVRVVTDYKSYVFELKSLQKLIKKADKPVK